MNGQINISVTGGDQTPLLQPPELSWPVKQMILRSGRSWWMARYESGKILAEWDTIQKDKTSTDLTGAEKTTLRDLLTKGFRSSLWLPFASQGGTTQWEDIPKRGMRGLYLVCPVGAPGVAALETSTDYQFFQLKVGYLTAGEGRQCAAHIIGKVKADDGRCICYAWEYARRKIVRFEDNVTHMAYEGIGPLRLDQSVGIK